MVKLNIAFGHVLAYVTVTETKNDMCNTKFEHKLESEMTLP